MTRRAFVCGRCRFARMCYPVWTSAGAGPFPGRRRRPDDLEGEDLAGFRLRYCIPGQLGWTRGEKDEAAGEYRARLRGCDPPSGG